MDPDVPAAPAAWIGMPAGSADGGRMTPMGVNVSGSSGRASVLLATEDSRPVVAPARLSGSSPTASGVQMLEPIQDAPAGIVAVRAVGKVTAQDYDAVLEPAMQ